MNRQMQRIDQVGAWLDKINALPLGHPDRLRFLNHAERILESAAGERPRQAVVARRRRPERLARSNHS